MQPPSHGRDQQDTEGQTSTLRRGLGRGIVRPRPNRPPLASKRGTDIPRRASGWDDPRNVDPADQTRIASIPPRAY
jgi:hypothetical protein